MAMFTLMRKNEEVMIFQIGEDGNIVKLGKKENTALLPLQNRTSPRGLIEWWRDRAIPIKQGKIENMFSAFVSLIRSIQEKCVQSMTSW